MEKILKNTTGADIEIREIGLTIPASSQITINTTDYLLLASDGCIAEITPFINSGDIVVNEGSTDLTPSAGIREISFPFQELSHAYEFEYFEEEAQSNTTSNAWVTVLDETTSTKSGGDYIISYQAEITNSNKQKEVGFRVRVNSTSIADSRDGVSADNQYQLRSGFKQINLAEGTHQLRIDFGQTDEGGTGRIRKSRISIQKVRN